MGVVMQGGEGEEVNNKNINSSAPGWMRWGVNTLMSISKHWPESLC